MSTSWLLSEFSAKHFITEQTLITDRCLTTRIHSTNLLMLKWRNYNMKSQRIPTWSFGVSYRRSQAQSLALGCIHENVSALSSGTRLDWHAKCDVWSVFLGATRLYILLYLLTNICMQEYAWQSNRKFISASTGIGKTFRTACFNDLNADQTTRDPSGECQHCLQPKFIWRIFKNPVRTAKKTLHCTVEKINRLTLFKEMIAVYSGNRKNFTITLRG
jgi:hypothetical protein